MTGIVNVIYNIYVVVIFVLISTKHQAIFQREDKTHKSTNKQNKSTTEKLEKPQWPWLGTGISKEMFIIKFVLILLNKH